MVSKSAKRHQEILKRQGWIEVYGAQVAPAFKIMILSLICFIAVGVRVFSIIRYESVIHEFDPWFNFRGTKLLEEKGWYAFKYWNDHESWYPLGRYNGHTLFPGLMLTAWSLHGLLNKFMLLPIGIKDVCVFTAPLFAGMTSIVTYLLTVEVTKKSESGLISALFMAIVPSYLSRSVAGSYDNEAVAIFALVFSFYCFVRAVNRGTLMSGLISAISFYYMVLTWGGYVFVLGVISIYVIGLILTENFNSKVYVAFSIFYIIGNLLSLTMPYVAHWAVWESSEHLPSHIAYIVMNVYMLSQFIKKNLSKRKFKFLTNAVIRVSIVLIIVGFLYIVVMGKTTAGHRILTLINPVYAKKHNPLIASISEHQPTSWSSFWFDLQYTLLFAPIGIYVVFLKPTNAKLFIALYGMLAVYFSSVMIRLLLAAAPACCILSGIGVSHVMQTFAVSIRKFMYDLLGGGPKIVNKKRRYLPCEFAVVGLGLISYLVCKVVWHGSWTGAEAYSHPTIVMSYKDRGGKRVIVDDYREAYYWLRRNTKQDAKVMSWWDYGYQIAGMANRTTIVDNNTWNKTHIAKVGMTFASREEEAHDIAMKMDIDYMLVVFGGISGYSGDDINKFLWMIRIGGSENPHIKESDYYGAGGQYRVDQGGSRPLLNSLMYKLCYYRFGEIDQGKGHGYDVQRQATIGNPNINLDYFEEAFSTKNWIVRIFRVKKKGNRDRMRFEEDKKTTSVQALSGLSEGLSAKISKVKMSNWKNSLHNLKDSYFKEMLQNSQVPLHQSDIMAQNNFERKLTAFDPDEEKPISTYIKGFDLFSIQKAPGFDFARIKEINQTVLDVIRKVEIVECKIKAPPKSLLFFPRIKRLRLNKNSISSIDCDVFLQKIVKHLEFLDLSDNNIQSIPVSFHKNTSKLKKLFLSRNPIGELPRQLFLMDHLEELHINGNRFDRIHVDFLNMKSLEVLNLDWFNYLPGVVETPLSKSKDILFQKFLKALQHIKQQGGIHLNLKDFPRLLTDGQTNRFKVKRDFLCRAAYKGDLTMISYFAEQNPELLTSLNKKGLDPFNVALKYGQIKSFSELLNYSNTFQEYSENFGSVLILAVQSGNPKVVDLMLKRGIDVNITDKLGNSALHYVFQRLKEPNINVYHKMTEKLLGINSLDLNQINKDDETPLLQAIKQETQYPFLLAEVWNDNQQNANQGSHFKNNQKSKKFDLDIPDKKNGQTCLHYAAQTNFIGLNNLIIYQAPRSSFTVDNKLKLPLEYKSSQFLVSKKMLVDGFRKNLRRHWIQGNSEVRLFEEKVDYRLKENMETAKKAKRKTFIRTLDSIKKENNVRRENKSFTPIPNKFFSNLNQYQKTSDDFVISDEKPTLISTISYIETILNLLIKKTDKKNLIVKKRNVNLLSTGQYTSNKGIDELKKLLTDSKVMKILREIITVFKYIKNIRKLLMINYQSKDLLFVKENLEMPTLFLINKFIRYLQENGTTFNYRVTILLVELLYFDFALPFSPDGNSLENNTTGFKDPNAPSKILYWKQMTSIWSSTEFIGKDMDLIKKMGYYDHLKGLLDVRQMY